MGEYSYILKQQGKTTSEKLAAFTAAIGWRDELATYRIVQDEYEMRAAAAAEQGISLLDVPPYTAEELAALDAESAAYYDAFAANYVATAAFTGSGSGTQSDPYIITNRAQLEAINDGLTAYYRLANDIDLGGSGSPWAPLGSVSTPFSGSLDGDGYKISNLYVSGEINSGLFVSIGQNANIKQIQFLNLTMDDCARCGAVSAMAVGSENNYVYVDSIAVSGITISNTDVTRLYPHAGIVGEPSYADISNCIVSDSDISGKYTIWYMWAFSGGIAAYIKSHTYIRNCYVIDTQFTATGGSRASAGGIGILGGSATVSACVVIDSTMSAPVANRILCKDSDASGATISITDVYATTTTTLNGEVASGGTTTNLNGADVSASTYNTQAFWESTLGWDFDTIWYWDDTEQLPKLRAFLHGPTISSVSATPTTGGTTTQITLSATVQDATSYQWQYSANSGGTWQDITGATAATAKWTPGAVGTYQVQLLATNSDGTTTSDPVTITIYPSPTISDVTIYPNPSDESATFLMSVTVNES